MLDAGKALRCPSDYSRLMISCILIPFISGKAEVNLYCVWEYLV